MDHSMMDMDMPGHDHGDHGGHDMPAMPHKCSMNMLFTWSTQDLCLVFRWWHIDGTFSLIVSLLAVVALGVGYEYTRLLARRQSVTTGDVDDDEGESSSLLPGRTVARRRGGRLVKALLYGGQVFYSFFIMLLFMTYNGWVMIAVAVGAAAGHLIFGGEAEKSVACH